jgi:hypothetical protein
MKHALLRNHSLARLGSTTAILLIATGLMAVAAMFLVRGSKHDVAFALAVAISPLAAYLAFNRPLIFPYGLYVLLVPFDNLLNISGTGTVTKLLGILSGAAICFWLLRKKRFEKPSLSVAIWLLFAAWATLSVFWAIDTAAALSGLFTYVELILLLAIVAVMPADVIDVYCVVWACICGACLASLYGLYLLHTGHDLLIARVGNSQIARVAIGINGTAAGEIDPNHFGNALLMPIALASSIMLRCRWSVDKCILLGCVGLLFGGLYASGSRESLLGAVVVFLVLLRSPYRVQILIFGLLLLLSSIVLPHSPWQRFSDITQTGGAGRLAIWKVAMNALTHYWARGAGIGNFSFAYDRSYDAVYQPPNQVSRWHFQAHNTALGIAVELGIVGMGLLLAAWYLQLREVMRLQNGVKEFVHLYFAAEASLIALFVASMFIDMLPYKYLWLSFYFVSTLRAASSRVMTPVAKPLASPPSGRLGQALQQREFCF